MPPRQTPLGHAPALFAGDADTYGDVVAICRRVRALNDGIGDLPLLDR
jgi:hypothetical protein